MDNSNALMMGSIGKMLGDYGGNPGKGMDWGGPLNTMTQLMATKSFRDMMAQVLGPDGTSMKLGKGGIDLSGFTPEMLSKILAGGGGENNPESFYKEIGAMGTPPKVSSMGGGSSVASPFGQDQSVSNTDFLSGDLAGLSPEHIATIMGIKLKKDELGQKKISDVMDMLYKGAGIRNMESKITARGLPKDERTAEIKNYEYAKANGFEGSIVDFKNEASTSYQKEYQQAVDEGYPKKSFNKWLGWRLRQGATVFNLGDVAEKERTIGQIRRESEVLQSGFAQKVLDDLKKDDKSWRATGASEERARSKNIPFDQARKEVQIIMHREEMGRRIKQVFPKAKFIRDGWYLDGDKLVGDVL